MTEVVTPSSSTSVPARARAPRGLGRLRGPSEDELARRVARGDEQAFAVLCRRRHHRLHAVAYDVLRDHDEARDAVQNAMVSALGALRRGQLRGDVRPWLHRICVNEALSLLRRRRILVELEEDAHATPATADPAASLLLREQLSAVAADLVELPERPRRALLLREVAELSYGDVAEALHLSPEAARQAVADARRGLRDLAAGREDACADVRALLQDGDARRQRSRRLVAHLRGCPSCRRYQRSRASTALQRAVAPFLALGGTPSWLAALLPGGAGQATVAGAGRAAIVVVTVAVAPAAVGGAPSAERPVGPRAVARWAAPAPVGASAAAGSQDFAADPPASAAAWRRAAGAAASAAGPRPGARASASGGPSRAVDRVSHGVASAGTSSGRLADRPRTAAREVSRTSGGERRPATTERQDAGGGAWPAGGDAGAGATRRPEAGDREGSASGSGSGRGSGTPAGARWSSRERTGGGSPTEAARDGAPATGTAGRPAGTGWSDGGSPRSEASTGASVAGAGDGDETGDAQQGAIGG